MIVYAENCFVVDETAEVLEGDFNELSRQVSYKLNTVLHFGKYKGKTIEEIIILDPKYIYWMGDKEFNLTQEVKTYSNSHTKQRAKDAGYEKRDGNYVRVHSDPERGLKDFRNEIDDKMFGKHDIGFDEENLTMSDLL